ncbi:glutamine synthetase family protein [Kitasatospora hibisci]|uniref:glutamine synthetase family protein n=1 Tax=Kitasatospora hibisci TaxID=3369522 RepID=UPI00375483CA
MARKRSKQARTTQANALPTPTSGTGDTLEGWVADGTVDTVLLGVVDGQGRLKGKELDAEFLLPRLCDGSLTPEVCGYLFDTDLGMSASWGGGLGDLLLLPDRSRATRLPWLPATALLPAEPIAPGAVPLPTGPVAILQEQLVQLTGLGYRLKVGIETEFTIFEGTAEHAADDAFRQLVPVTRDNRDYALDQPSQLTAYTRHLRRVLREAGMPVEAVKTESSPGQVEVTFPYGEAEAACWQHVLFKHAARAVADQHRMSATFMAAPVTGVGSGMHLHVSLWRGEEPVMCAERTEAELSAEGLAAVAGVLEVLPVTGLMWAPYVNSYRRLRPRSFAPTRAVWGRDNRTCAVRVVGHGRGLHLEVRVPGADANPYVALAAVAAGIRHGLERELKPPQACEGDGYEAWDAPALPTSLTAAVAAMESSPLALELLGAEVAGHLVVAGRREVLALAHAVTDAELAWGFAQA